MTKHEAKNAGTPSSKGAEPKVYRSINEIRRAFYPKASEQRSAGVARAKNGILGGKADASGAR